MRAWLLLLAVLATFKPIVQVASTEDLSTRFITAISTRSSTATTTVTKTTSTTASTALAEPFRAVLLEDKTSLPIASSSSTSSSSATATASSAATSSSALFYTNSDSNSDSDKNSIDKSDENLIIEIKNIEESEGGAIENIIGPVQENNSNRNSYKRTKKVQRLENLAKKQSEKLQSNRFEAIFSTKLPATTTTSSTAAAFSSGRSSQISVMSAEESANSEMTTELAPESSLAISSSDAIAVDTEHHQQHKHKDHQHKHKDHNHHQHHHQHHHHHHHHHHHNKQHHHSDQQQHHDRHHDRHHDQPEQQQQHHDQHSAHIDESDHSEDSGDLHNADADDDSAAAEQETFSNKEVISEKLKPDPSTLVEIENSLLSLFNMKRPPKIDRSKIVIPEAMKQLYAQIMGHDIDSVNIPKPGLLTKSANTVRSFTHLDSKIDERFPHHHRFRLHFDVKSIPAEEKLKAAELQLSRKAISHATLNPRLATRTRYQVLVYDITRLGVRGKREPTYLLLDNKTIRLNSTDTISLDVQPAVDRWLETPKKNYGLLIEVRTFRTLKPAPHHHVRLRRSADETHDDWQRRQPLLFTYTDDGRHKSRSIRDVSTRSKRAGHHRKPHRRKNNEEICRRQSLYVDFTDVGWSDWIVAPPGYDAYYCHGKCPFPLAEHLNSTNHAVVQTLVNNLNPGKVPKACCVPTQLTGISMLYLNDQSTVVLKNYQDMTVVGCGCR